MTWKEDLKDVPTFRMEIEMERNKTALLVVDIQNAVANPGGAHTRFLKSNYPDIFSYIHARLTDVVVPNNVKLIQFFRENGMRVLYLGNGSELPGFQDYLALRRERAAVTGFMPYVGTPDHEILDELKPRPDELFITKRSTSAFNSTAIDQILRNMGIDGLIITGVATHACVGLTARDAADRGYKCIVVDDACAAHTQKLHDAFLMIFANIHGLVMTTDEVVAYLEQCLSKKEKV